jgi:hypothetical protein
MARSFGRIFLSFGYHQARTPTHGQEAARERIAREGAILPY